MLKCIQYVAGTTATRPSPTVKSVTYERAQVLAADKRRVRAAEPAREELVKVRYDVILESQETTEREGAVVTRFGRRERCVVRAPQLRAIRRPRELEGKPRADEPGEVDGTQRPISQQGNYGRRDEDSTVL